ncbi:MAG TPA: N-acetyltransferase [Cyanobacteria bacterium UBA11371]|nr:N-acetyltransferase [Cyanobacteria bacterium UBA11371]HBE34874.1 N-acetyltransferase [Cyanobacteria bacterium UBA11368]
MPAKVFLETERLILRQFTESDAENLFELDSDREVIRFANLGIIKGGEPTDTDRETIRNKTLPRLLAYYQKYEGYGFWAAIEKFSHEFIGWFQFRPALDSPFNVTSGLYDNKDIELGYRLRKVSWGKGYATEGAKALVVKGFSELGTQRVVSSALAANGASSRVMEKAGLKFWQKYIHPEIEPEVVIYALNKEEFKLEEYITT